jgi:hypothetical protein
LSPTNDVEPGRDGLDVRGRALTVALAEPLVREAHDITIYEASGSSKTAPVSRRARSGRGSADDVLGFAASWSFRSGVPRV